MADSVYIVRNRKNRLLQEEENLAKALRGKLPPKYFRLDERRLPNERAWLNFYFEYFMTFHVNGLKTSNKLWCDGALIEKLSQRNNRYIFSGYLYLLPEGEVTPPKWQFVKNWSTFPFKGFVQLYEGADKIKDYKFKIQIENLEFTCKRKI